MPNRSRCKWFELNLPLKNPKSIFWSKQLLSVWRDDHPPLPLPPPKKEANKQTPPQKHKTKKSKQTNRQTKAIIPKLRIFLNFTKWNVQQFLIEWWMIDLICFFFQNPWEIISWLFLFLKRCSAWLLTFSVTWIPYL